MVLIIEGGIPQRCDHGDGLTTILPTMLLNAGDEVTACHELRLNAGRLIFLKTKILRTVEEFERLFSVGRYRCSS